MERTGTARGGTLPLCAWLPDVSVLHPYVAVGFGYGANDTKDDKWGYAILENFGCAALLWKHFTINAELAAAQPHNEYEKRDAGLVRGSVNGGLLF